MTEPALVRHLRDAIEAGYPALAAELARACLARQPETLPVLLHYAAALQELGRLDEAASALDRAERLAAGDERVELHHRRGGLAEAEGRLDDAAGHYEEAVRLAPEEARGYVALGMTQLRRRRPDDAVRALRRAVGCEGDEPEVAWCALGIALRGRGEYLEALECFRAAIALDPDYPAALEARADVERVLFDFPAE
jgi:tetratricopeptide (TPR) repeat protein